MNIREALIKASGIFPPEFSKDIALYLLRHGLYTPLSPKDTYANLATQLGHLQLPHPVGIPAGMDKNANTINGLLGLGCSFLEVGTITPLPQMGNPKPRVFRIGKSQELINRLGLNNVGAEIVAQTLASRTDKGIVGLSAGYNADSEDPILDFQKVIRLCARNVDFLSLNVSCPNIHQSVDFDKPENIQSLLEKTQATLHEINQNKPIYLKLSPDHNGNQLNEIVCSALEAGISGLIATNSTLTRPNGKDGKYSERGGLTGPSLFPLSTKILAQIYSITQGQIPLIGVGGISSPSEAYEKIKAGANAIQLYTALTYQGGDLIVRICKEMSHRINQDGLKSISEVVGTEFQKWLE